MRSVQQVQGQNVIDIAADAATQRSLTSSQLFEFYKILSPYYELLRNGELMAFSDVLSDISVDGTIITIDTIAQLQTVTQAYISANSE